MTILEKLADHARERVALQKQIVSENSIRERALQMPRGKFAFENALKTVVVVRRIV